MILEQLSKRETEKKRVKRTEKEIDRNMIRQWQKDRQTT
jgi:hypothetical protein